MLTTKQEKKFNSIIHNHINGNRKDSAQAIRKLTKLELVLLITNLFDLYSSVKIDRVLFEDFIITALETK